MLTVVLHTYYTVQNVFYAYLQGPQWERAEAPSWLVNGNGKEAEASFLKPFSADLCPQKCIIKSTLGLHVTGVTMPWPGR